MDKRICQFYEFGPFRLDTAEYRLERDGQEVSLPPKLLGLLLQFVQNSGRTLSKDDLASAVWLDASVSDETLAKNVSRLRSVLGDRQDGQHYIETKTGYGYRFTAEVRAVQDPPSSTVGESGQRTDIKKEDRSESSGGLSTAPGSALAGHRWHALAASAIYAAYFGVALLVEIAYQFDSYGETGQWIAILFSGLIFVSSLYALSLGLKRTSSGKGHGLTISLAVFGIAAVAVAISACWFLPAEPITKANFQTYTAQAAYFKDLCYIVPLGLLFLVVPLHFVVGVERELRTQESPFAINLLTGEKPSATPTGTVYLRTWFLLILLIGMASYSLPARGHLFDNLKPSPYMSLFQNLIHVRMILFFSLAILCVTWYHRALNDMKREAWRERTVARV